MDALTLAVEGVTAFDRTLRIYGGLGLKPEVRRLTVSWRRDGWADDAVATCHGSTNYVPWPWPKPSLELVPKVATPDNPNACRYAAADPGHVCTDSTFGEPLPAGSSKICQHEGRRQLLEQAALIRSRGSMCSQAVPA